MSLPRLRVTDVAFRDLRGVHQQLFLDRWYGSGELPTQVDWLLQLIKSNG